MMGEDDKKHREKDADERKHRERDVDERKNRDRDDDEKKLKDRDSDERKLRDGDGEEDRDVLILKNHPKRMHVMQCKYCNHKFMLVVHNIFESTYWDRDDT